MLTILVVGNGFPVKVINPFQILKIRMRMTSQHEINIACLLHHTLIRILFITPSLDDRYRS